MVESVKSNILRIHEHVGTSALIQGVRNTVVRYLSCQKQDDIQ